MTIETVTIVGAGTMGSGIAITVVQNGLRANIVDISQDAVDRAVTGAGKFFARQVEKGRMDAAAMADAMARLTGGTDLAAAAESDLVIEAVFEDLDIKLETFTKLNAIVGADTIVATNTSCLRVSDLARALDNPGRFLGMHYFSPAAINPLVEVVRGPDTDGAVVERVIAFCSATGKQPLLCRDQNGFAVNRFFCPYTNEAAHLLDEGLGTPAQIDRVAQEALGVAVGPFFVMNIIKPRINLHAIKYLAPLGDFYRPASAMVAAGEADAPWELGEDQRDPAADQAIADRLRGATFLPVLEELDEEVASPADIDMGASLALKFGKTPCSLMDELGRDEVARMVTPLCEKFGVSVPRSLARVGSLRAA